jgi:hypothetical protein
VQSPGGHPTQRTWESRWCGTRDWSRRWRVTRPIDLWASAKGKEVHKVRSTSQRTLRPLRSRPPRADPPRATAHARSTPHRTQELDPPQIPPSTPAFDELSASSGAPCGTLFDRRVLPARGRRPSCTTRCRSLAGAEPSRVVDNGGDRIRRRRQRRSADG